MMMALLMITMSNVITIIILQCADLCDENPACASFEFQQSTSEGLGRRSAICRYLGCFQHVILIAAMI